MEDKLEWIADSRFPDVLKLFVNGKKLNGAVVFTRIIAQAIIPEKKHTDFYVTESRNLEECIRLAKLHFETQVATPCTTS